MSIFTTKLWLIKQSKNCGYDSYDSAVVAAPHKFQAQYTHPDDFSKFNYELDNWGEFNDRSWTHPRNVVVEYLGTTEREISGVVVSSYNAG